jgi:hypothetical protein
MMRSCSVYKPKREKGFRREGRRPRRGGKVRRVVVEFGQSRQAEISKKWSCTRKGALE